MYKEVFKLRIAARREELGLTQGGVAIDTEIGQSKISKYETGKQYNKKRPSPGLLERVKLRSVTERGASPILK